MTDGCTNFRKFLVEGTKPNLKKIKEYVERSLMLVTALSPVIGYDKASKIAHYAMDNDLTLKAAALKLGFVRRTSSIAWSIPTKMVKPYVAAANNEPTEKYHDNPIPSTNRPDVLLVGAGIMSATLAVILKELDPSLKIEIYEVLGSEAQESSNAWNNAGTGHAALCELNYTPEKSDGSIDISKALQVNTEFDLSRQLWAYLGEKGSDQRPAVVYSSRTPHEFCARIGECRVSQKTLRGALRPSPLSRDGIFRRQEAD